MAELITTVNCDDPRMSAIKLKTVDDQVLIINVYMPTDYNDNNSLEAYTDTCSKINAS